jgi:putative acetyltransferase
MIRKYEDKDLAGLLDVWYEASLVATPFLDEAFLAQERENIEQLYIPRTQPWVYEAAGQVVGFISVFDDEVGGLFVYPDWQRKGIGKALMDKVRESHETLELEVFADNGNARGFYEHYGFVAFKEYFHESSGFNMVRMRLEK